MLFVVISCDKEDTTATGLALGEWKLVKYRIGSAELEVTDCFTQTTFILNKDNTFSRVTYTNTEDCSINLEASGTGTYEYIGSYAFNLKYTERDTTIITDLIINPGETELRLIQREELYSGLFVDEYTYERIK